MGQSSTNSNTTQQSTTAPGATSAPVVNGIIGQLTPQIANSGITPTEQTAINQLTQNGVNGNPYAPAIGANANTLLSGGGATSQNGALSSNLSSLQGELSPYTNPNYSTVNSPQVAAALASANNDVTNSVNGEFAAAGRDGSGMNQQTLARGIAQADAPIILNQANQDTATRLAASNALYGAGNTTAGAITGNNQTALSNEQAGTGAATNAITAQNEGPTAAIEAQELGKSIPAQDLGLLAQIGIPIAGLNTTTSGTGQTNGTSNPSLLQDITGIGGLFAGGPLGATSAASGIGSALSGGAAGLSGLLAMI